MVLTAVLTFIFVSAIGGAGFYVYWERQKETPQYSLALMIEAARNNDEEVISSIVDIEAVVDDFVPRIAGKAAELYGRGIPPATIQKIAQIAQPVMPAVKDRARRELPQAIRTHTAEFQNVPFAAMVFGADRYLDITVKGNTALVRSRDAEHQTELLMEKNGARWKIVGIRDEELAHRIAQAIGQEIIDFAVNGPSTGGGRKSLNGIDQLLREAEEILK